VGLYAGNEIVILKRIDFLDLDSGRAHLLHQLREDTRVRFNCAPLIKHIYI
jgi:hypothetical protein